MGNPLSSSQVADLARPLLGMVETMVKSLGESLARYEDCQKKTGDKHPWAGYMLCREDSRESMLRRITCIREQLLVLGEQIKKE